MKLGSHDYQIIAVEGYFSAGSADLTVSEGCRNGSKNNNGAGSTTTRLTGSTTTTPSTDIGNLACALPSVVSAVDRVGKARNAARAALPARL
ncbi:hypothetical protein LTR22_027074 [Elasticomyces elasticus]|nr:hypothetical protein LTR22_027074 [Elasticomyces elasticus]